MPKDAACGTEKPGKVESQHPQDTSGKSSDQQGCLTIARRVGEAVVIGDDVCIWIDSARTGQVRISIQAPRSVPVYRKEIYDRIQDEKAEGQNEERTKRANA